MAVTQYIGARYVPMFSDPLDWDSTKAYEPLTIVYYLGNSYTSRQSVPTGIDIANTDYWAITGNYNAQIEAYRKEVQAYDGRITENAEAIAAEVTRAIAGEKAVKEAATALVEAEAARAKAAEEAEATRAKAAESELATGVSNALTSVSEEREARTAADAIISGEIATSRYNGHRIVFIGDSYTYGTGASDHGGAEQERFSTQLAKMLGGTECNYGVGATGFCDPGSTGDTFNVQVTKAYNDMTEDERSDVRLVVIAGGINDEREGTKYGSSEMKEAAKTVCTNAHDSFPNAHIVVFPMLWCGYQWQYHAFNFETAIASGALSAKCATVVQGCWTWNFGIAGNIADDNLHPTTDGHAVIAERMFESLVNGSTTNYCNALFVPTIDGGSTDNRTYGIFQNGSIHFGGMYCGSSSTITSSTKIGTVPAAMYPQVNIYAPVCKGDKIIATFAITTSGNIYIIPDSSITLPAYVGPFSYIPYGGALH